MLIPSIVARSVLGVAVAACAVEVVADWKEVRSFPAEEARQAAAADEQFVYAITNRVVARYDRKSGRRVDVSTGEAQHLNSGYIHDGRLLCAHSNYPSVPEQSEIKVLDVKTMKLTTFHAFQDYGGSLTWVIRKDGQWWCNFAKYDDQNAKTFLARFDDNWKETGRWTYPPEVIRQLNRYSLSGGLWRGDVLLATDHDHQRLYRLQLPEKGTRLHYLGSQSAPFTGQGIALDPVSGGLIGINRARKRIVFAGQIPLEAKRSVRPRPATSQWMNRPVVELPTGMPHRYFHSAAAGQDVGYCIYLPPGYEKSAARYPAIYNLHGNGGHEVHSLEDAVLLHAGILEGRWPAMIMVLPNGGQSPFFKDSFDGRFPVETMLIRELIPHIDRTYRTDATRQG
jgi:hypothetical protein